MSSPKKQSQKSVIQFDTKTEKVVGICDYDGVLVVATDKAVYAYGDAQRIRKVFPDAG